MLGQNSIWAHAKQMKCTICCFRFLDSELDVHDEIQKLHVIATAPELYSILVQQNAIPTLLGLLSHENTGILSHASHANFPVINSYIVVYVSPMIRM